MEKAAPSPFPFSWTWHMINCSPRRPMTITSSKRIEGLILEQLSQHEMRVLTLLVAVRKSLSGPAPFKGDLSDAVASALRRLVASRSIIETGGVFSLWPNPQAEHTGDPVKCS